MNLIEIDNLELPQLQIYRTMRGNAFDKANSFIADSPKVVNMLLESDVEIRSILATPEYYETHQKLIEARGIPELYVGPKGLLETIVGHSIHHNVMLHGVRPDNVPLEDLGDRIILLDTLANMENVGAIARSAAALGVDSYAVPINAPHPYGRRAIRVSMGYVTKLQLHRFEDTVETITELKASGYRIYGAEAHPDATPLAQIADLPEKWVIVMGNEESGLSDKVIAVCDELVQIEMAEGVKSFNVAIAASIIMHRFATMDSKDIITTPTNSLNF